MRDLVRDHELEHRLAHADLALPTAREHRSDRAEAHAAAASVEHLRERHEPAELDAARATDERGLDEVEIAVGVAAEASLEDAERRGSVGEHPLGVRAVFGQVPAPHRDRADALLDRVKAWADDEREVAREPRNDLDLVLARRAALAEPRLFAHDGATCRDA
ncbi:MAG: hypothetical protein H6723_19385 [Sandaracinus sp.]|nr:hypothetical protein [Sandaracinus sp.]